MVMVQPSTSETVPADTGPGTVSEVFTGTRSEVQTGLERTLDQLSTMFPSWPLRSASPLRVASHRGQGSNY